MGGAGGASLQNNALVVKTDGKVGIGTTTPAYKLDVNGDMINGWFRSRGQTGWYSQDYGGGWYMIDPWWIRSVGSKNVWVDQVIGSNAGLTVGYGGQGPPSTGAIIAGNVGIGTSGPLSKLHVYSTGNTISGVQGGVQSLWGMEALSNTNAMQIGNLNGADLNPSIFLNSGGNVGIGTTAPTQKARRSRKCQDKRHRIL